MISEEDHLHHPLVNQRFRETVIHDRFLQIKIKSTYPFWSLGLLHPCWYQPQPLLLSHIDIISNYSPIPVKKGNHNANREQTYWYLKWIQINWKFIDHNVRAHESEEESTNTKMIWQGGTCITCPREATMSGIYKFLGEIIEAPDCKKLCRGVIVGKLVQGSANTKRRTK